MEGVINEDGTVTGDDGKTYFLPVRGNYEGYPEVLMDAKDVGGHGSFSRQSVKPYVGMRIIFVISPSGFGYNFSILKQQ